MSAPSVLPDIEAGLESHRSESDIDHPDLDTQKEGLAKEPETTYPDGGKSWFVAIGGAFVLFSTFGYANAFGVLQEYLQSHQLEDCSPSQISWIGSIQLCFLFATMLVGGPLFDQYGAKFLTPSAVLYIFSVMMTSICKEYWHFMLAMAILGGVTMGLAMAPIVGAIGHHFDKKRGAAMGLAISGSSLGGVLFPIMLGKMLNNSKLSFGWSIRICGFVMAVLIFPSCYFVRARLPPRKGTFFILAAWKNPLFLSLAGSSFLIMMGLFMPFFFLPTYAVSRGMSTELASFVISILNAASFFGRVIPGVLGDKWGRINIYFAAGLSSGILVLCFTLMKTNAAIIVFSALYGFCQGAIVSGLTVSLTTVPKDQREIGTYMGMGMSVIAIAVLIGPPINGAFVSKYDGFAEVSYFSGAFVLAGALLTIYAKYSANKGVFGIA